MAKNSAINISSASSVIVTDEDGVLIATSPMTNGQVIIGSTDAAPVAASLTAGSGITITPGAGALTIATSGIIPSGGLINVQYLTSGSGTYTATAGTNKCIVLAVGGGGVGNRVNEAASKTNNTMTLSEGGSSGAWGMKYYATAPTGAAYSVGSGGFWSTSFPFFPTDATSTTFNDGDMDLSGGERGRASIDGTSTNQLIRTLPDFFSTSQIIAQPASTDLSDIKGNGQTAPVVILERNPSSISGFSFLNNSGAPSHFGPGGAPPILNTSLTFASIEGNPGAAPGSGGSGGLVYNNSGTSRSMATALGGSGANGIIIIYEYS